MQHELIFPERIQDPGYWTECQFGVLINVVKAGWNRSPPNQCQSQHYYRCRLGKRNAGEREMVDGEKCILPTKARAGHYILGT